LLVDIKTYKCYNLDVGSKLKKVENIERRIVTMDNQLLTQDTIVYDKSTVTENTIRFSKDSFRTYTPVEPEYVLKVNNINDSSIAKELSKHSKVSKNPNNLPAVRKNVSMKKVKKIIALTFLFVSAFSVAAIIGYNVTFMLFTIK
jgi:hypothetical protein